MGLGEAEAVWYRHRFIDQPVMDNQLVFWLGLAPTGLTDVGEVLDTATRITPGDERSWFAEWSRTARRVEGYGDDAAGRGHTVSAASHYLRAGAYYRAGLMRYADRRDPELFEASRRALELHDRALAMKGYDSHELEIPCDGGKLFGRMHYSGAATAPTVVLHQGLHAWPEDTMWVIDGALERGYHVLSFHGPGQGATLREHGLPFRPDWEVPVGAVIDFASSDTRVDDSALILMGLSFGGYLAGRAASREHRLRALVVNPGVVSWADAMLRHYHEIPGIMALHGQGPDAFNAAIDAATVAMPDAGWYFEDATWKHGVESPHALVADLARYDNAEGVARIQCPTLIMEGTAEDASPGESQRFFELLQARKHLMVFDASTASQMHCQGGNQTLARAWLYDWLDEELGQ